MSGLRMHDEHYYIDKRLYPTLSTCILEGQWGCLLRSIYSGFLPIPKTN